MVNSKTLYNVFAFSSSDPLSSALSISGNGEITELEWPVEGSTPGSGSVLDVYGDTVVMCRSSFREPYSLVLCSLPPRGQEDTVQWIPVTSWLSPADLQNCELHYIPLLAENVTDTVRECFIFIFVFELQERERSVLLNFFLLTLFDFQEILMQSTLDLKVSLMVQLLL